MQGLPQLSSLKALFSIEVEHPAAGVIRASCKVSIRNLGPPFRDLLDVRGCIFEPMLGVRDFLIGFAGKNGYPFGPLQGAGKHDILHRRFSFSFSECTMKRPPMSIPPTPALVEAIYNMLILTKPFCRWKLPPAEEVHIEIRHSPLCAQWWHDDNREHHIMVSDKRHETLGSMMISVAHEMCHMHVTMKERAEHGPLYQKAADLVCKYHKWDRGQF